MAVKDGSEEGFGMKSVVSGQRGADGLFRAYSEALPVGTVSDGRSSDKRGDGRRHPIKRHCKAAGQRN
jgi:hypothetical protein